MAPTNRVLGEDSAAEEGVGCHCYAASLRPWTDADRVTSQQMEEMGRVWGNGRENTATGKLIICQKIKEVLLVHA